MWGYVADHYDRRVLVLRMAGFAALAGFSGFFIGDTFGHFMLAMIVLNLFTSGQAPICEALMLSEMKGDLTYYGRIRMWGSIGFIVSVTLASLRSNTTASSRCRGWRRRCWWRPSPPRSACAMCRAVRTRRRRRRCCRCCAGAR
jgi:MFS family permease